MFWQTESCLIRDAWARVQSDNGFKLGVRVPQSETTVQLHVSKHSSHQTDVGLPKHGAGDKARIVKWNGNWGIDDRGASGLGSSSYR